MKATKRGISLSCISLAAIQDKSFVECEERRKSSGDLKQRRKMGGPLRYIFIQSIATNRLSSLEDGYLLKKTKLSKIILFTAYFRIDNDMLSE